jgi:hypothetical protein
VIAYSAAETNALQMADTRKKIDEETKAKLYADVEID